MKTLLFYAASLFAALVAGCAAGPQPAVTSDHPASPRAAEGTTPAVASALAVTVDPPPPATAPSSAPTMYACPHHPEVTSDKPGTCPKCGGMKLEPVTKPTSKPAGETHDHSGHAGHGGEQ